ncbi:MAG: PorT family protein [Lentimicrobium sp.]|nr:PorT family protein [Lentimicrobium sp.]
MKSKIVSILTLLMLLSVATFSQQAGAGLTFGVIGGVNFQNLNGTDISGDKIENDLLTGFHAGANVQIPIAPEFYFQPGLLFSTKGAQNKEDAITTKFKLSYIELPLNFLYKGALGDGYIFLGFGPYLGYAIGGKTETSVGGAATIEQDIVFQNVVETDDPKTVPYYKPLDVGGNIFFGYEIAAGLFVQMNAQLGLVKINPEYKGLTISDESSIKNTGFGFSIGYRF